MSAEVEISAPSDMAEGYTFNASFQGITFPVKVPVGGVKAGDKIKVPVEETRIPLDSVFSNANGRWKDDICGCCSLGFCHPHWWCSCVCNICALAQVMTRMELNWLGQPALRSSWQRTFFIVVAITFLPLIVRSICLAIYFISINTTAYMIAQSLGLVIIVYIMTILVRTRVYIRERYGIQGGCFQDFCCSFWCQCCVVAQMLRQTHDYREDPVGCCSNACFCTTTGTNIEQNSFSVIPQHNYDDKTEVI